MLDRHRTPARTPPTLQEKTMPDIEPETGVEKSEVADQPVEPNENLMLIEQIDGACEVIVRLLEQLVPKTDDVEGCIITHKGWQDNNLRHLKKAFE